MGDDARTGARWSLLPLALIAAGCGPVVWTWFYDPNLRDRALPLGLAIAASLIVATLASVRRVPGLFIIPVAVAAGVAGMVLNGRFMGVWVTATVALAAWGVVGWVPLKRLPRPQFNTALALAGLGVAQAWISRGSHATRGAIALVIVLQLVVILVGKKLDLVETGVRKVIHWISKPLLYLAAIPIVLLPALAQRIFRWDALGAGGREVDAWVPLRPQADDTRRLWAPDLNRTRVGPARRLVGMGVSALTVLFLVPILLLVSLISFPSLPGSVEDAIGDPEPPANDVVASMTSEPWWHEYDRESARSYETSIITQFAGLQIPDFQGKYLNVQDRQRRSWTPPAECTRPLRVWMFGGSTTYGVGNRDAYTLPSEIAKVAYRNGVPIEVANFGIPGDVGWQQARRLERELNSGTEKPDLVVFYDGGNDVASVGGMNDTDRLGEGDYIGPLDRIHMRLLSNLTQETESGRYVLNLREMGKTSHLTDEELNDRSVEQYLEADHLARLLLDDVDVPFIHVAQPTAPVRTPKVAGEAEYAPEDRVIWQRFYDALPPSIIDLSGALDDDPDPHFNDDMHVDEAGNAVIAESFWKATEDQIRPLAEEEGATCS